MDKADRWKGGRGKRIEDERKKADEEREGERRQAETSTFGEKEQEYERGPAEVLDERNRLPQGNIRLQDVYNKEKETGPV